MVDAMQASSVQGVQQLLNAIVRYATDTDALPPDSSHAKTPTDHNKCP